MVQSFSLRRQKGLPMDVVMPVQQCECTSCDRTVHLKWLIIANFRLHIFHHNFEKQPVVHPCTRPLQPLTGLSFSFRDGQTTCKIKYKGAMLMGTARGQHTRGRPACVLCSSFLPLLKVFFFLLLPLKKYYLSIYILFSHHLPTTDECSSVQCVSFLFPCVLEKCILL